MFVIVQLRVDVFELFLDLVLLLLLFVLLEVVFTVVVSTEFILVKLRNISLRIGIGVFTVRLVLFFEFFREFFLKEVVDFTHFASDFAFFVFILVD